MWRGAEWFVMESFPFDRYTFRLLTVERPPVELVSKQLEAEGYVYVKDHARFLATRCTDIHLWYY